MDRYEGDSVPHLHGVRYCISYCTSAQALADFAQLTTALKAEYRTKSPVIAFGGSYGGMLAGWMRIKYPDVLTGAIAASAPVAGFPENMGTAGLDSSAVCITKGLTAKGMHNWFDPQHVCHVVVVEIPRRVAVADPNRRELDSMDRA